MATKKNIMVNGVLTPVWQTDATAQQIDDAAAKSVWQCTPNLLINGDFRAGCLVDQRQGRVVKPSTTYYSDKTLTTAAGTTSAYVTAYRYATGTENGTEYASFKLEDTGAAPTYYAAQADVVRGYVHGERTAYTVDMWKMGWRSALLVENAGVTITANTQLFTPLNEVIDRLMGQTVTCSALLGDNTLRVATGQVTSSGMWGTTLGVMVGTASYGTAFVVIPGAGKTVVACKLELGDQQTLAHQDSSGNWVLNEVPSYADTLRECYRYLRCIPKYVALSGAADSVPNVYMSLPLSPPMRKVPVISQETPGNVVADIYFADGTSVRSTQLPSVSNNEFLQFKFGDLGKTSVGAIARTSDVLWLNAEL